MTAHVERHIRLSLCRHHKPARRLFPCLPAMTSSIAVSRHRCSAAVTRRRRLQPRSVRVAVVLCGSTERAVSL